MYILQALKQSINLNIKQTSPNILVGQINKTTKINQVKTKKKDESFVSLIRDNKITVFVLTFTVANLLFWFKPAHKSRPEILARNRLEPRV